MYHGCDECFEANTFNPVCQTMNYTLLWRTNQRVKFLKKFLPDFEFIELWEHDFDRECVENEDLKKFLKAYEFCESLDPRACLFGGRTNALILYYLCKPHEKIFYYDFCSLYPYVMKYGIYPYGHPIIISENFDYSKQYFGVIKCRILPPEGLYLPVLPLNINNKLIFTLCRKCAEEGNKELECNHCSDDRALEGTWISLEIDKAIEKGYKIIKYHQIWHFENKTQYDPQTKRGGLFSGYVNFNLKGKAEASGFPAACTTDQQKDQFIEEFLEKEGVKLDKDNIIFDSGQRTDRKDKLNCLWGFFGLNPEKTFFKILYKPEELDYLMDDDQYDIQHIDFCDEDFIQVNYSLKRGDLTLGSILFVDF